MNSPLQPDGIPMRVIANPGYQPRAQRVGHDVAGHGAQIFVMADGAIMKAALPYRGLPTEVEGDAAGGATLYPYAPR